MGHIPRSYSAFKARLRRREGIPMVKAQSEACTQRHFMFSRLVLLPRCGENTLGTRAEHSLQNQAVLYLP